ncbi:GTP 3',8-cyclase MoaA [Paraburkholderia sp. MM5384-R2]|uniref:GTP 3',8-cyclase MoaA n=1 Tax=Paraburkholderia sp. MM5384-R2 TaxID=2723097 RepID=UPI00178DED57|nr:cyclic pyranopterin phosphate synthase [Paraburkholderia sp. MM5384-R2]
MSTVCLPETNTVAIRSPLSRADAGAAAWPDIECIDALGRPLKDLRLSVIDQCNFRCTYCMPKEVFTKDYPFLSSSARLSFEQLATVAGAFVHLGVEKIRLTGGEPLLRKNLERLIERLAAMTTRDGRPVELALTTNGSLLAAKARALKVAGLGRVTVSLDSLDDPLFRGMNDVDFPVARVLEGIEAACAVGLAPVKVNTVVECGVNEHQIVPIARHFRFSGVTVRFIEFMDVGGAASWTQGNVFTSADARREIEQTFPLVPRAAARGSDTAATYRYADGGGEVGFISSVSQPFCGDCTRARVAADGKLYLCLFATESFDLRRLLDRGCGAGDLAGEIREVWARRRDRYSELREEKRAMPGKKHYPTVRMSLVGG